MHLEALFDELEKLSGQKQLLRMADSIVRKGKTAPKALIEAASRLGKRVEQSALRRGLDPQQQALKHVTSKQRDNMLSAALRAME